MNKLFNRLIYVCAVLLMLIPLVSCSGGGGGASGTAGGTTGTLSIGLTDAPGYYMNVFVTIAEVQVKQNLDDEESDWITVTAFDPAQTFDLLELQHGVIADLGLIELEAGQYGQMRLKLTEEKPDSHPYANYLIIEGEEGEDPVEVELRVLKSELKNGIKIVHGFTIIAGGATELILDFDAHKSVVQANGKKGWHLKPTIKVLETVNNSVSGTVDAGETNWLEDVSVSAQIYLSGTPDLKDEVTVAGSDASDNLGDYFIYLPPGTYNVVAAEAGYAPFCQEVDATGFFDHAGINFTLAEVATGTVTGIVTGLADGTYATLSFRQTLDCENGAADVQVEVLSVNIFVNNSYDERLSAGEYQLVVSSENETTLEEFPLIVKDGLTTDLNIDF